MNGNKQDKNVPIETRIYYSPFSLGVHWVLGTALLLYGTYLSLDQDFFGYFLVLMALYLIYYASKRSKLGEPVILLNSKGVKTINTVFTPWENVELIRTERRGKGQHAKSYLILRFVNKTAKGQSEDELDISDLDTSAERIADLINAYKRRNKQRE